MRCIHIPSSGEPFDREARLASYKMAYDFFREELAGGPLVCVCHSWLLYPGYKEVLKPTSNIVSFMGDFDIVEAEDGNFCGGLLSPICWREARPAKRWASLFLTGRKS